MYNNLYGSTSYGELTMSSTPLLVMFLGIIIFSGIIGLISLISIWKIYIKAGKKGWECLIPIYNLVVLLQIAKLPIWYMLLLFIPIVNIYAIFKIYIELAHKFGKSTGFGIGIVLLGIIFIPLLAFSDDKYEDEITKETPNVNNTFDPTAVINGVQTENDTIEIQNQFSNIESTNIPVENSNSNLDIDNFETSSNETVLLENDVIPEPVINDIESVPATLNDNINSEIISEPGVKEEPLQNYDIPNTMPEPTINAFNSMPIMENQINIDETISTDNNSEIIMPEIKTEPTLETVEDAQNIVLDIPNVELDTKKTCKSCGIELPEIVSICPQCGTDNE